MKLTLRSTQDCGLKTGRNRTAEKAAYTEAFEKYELELREDYACKIAKANANAKANADGKPHLVTVLAITLRR